MTALNTTDLLHLVARIVSAHLSNNEVASGELATLIHSVYAALDAAGAAPATPAAEKPQPAVSANKSVFPDYIVCLEDGKKLKMLKRHLSTAYGLTPKLYRERWGLPPDYPMVAPSYAKRRSSLAKAIGLGRKAATTDEPKPPGVKRVLEGVNASKRETRKKAA